ncbi:unnamed protein product [Somion occarium]|uniref:Uncharacterized protein n=1 Tax=Somion occarium TaxID=3059160 RepID=A0ABP1DD90_9APHY
MLTHRGFSAWITSEGRALYEFRSIVNEEKNLITCWIPSEVGKTFTIHWRDNGGLVDTASYIYLDGFEVPGYFLFGFGEASRGAARIGPMLQRPFTFGEVDESSEPTFISAENDEGVIQLAIKRIKRVGQAAPNVPRTPPVKVKDEATAKSVSSFGGPQPTTMQLPSTWDIVPYNPDEPDPYVTFEWRYRSLHYLVHHDLATLADIQGDSPEVEGENLPLSPRSGRELDSPSRSPSPSPSPANSTKKLSPVSSTKKPRPGRGSRGISANFDVPANYNPMGSSIGSFRATEYQPPTPSSSQSQSQDLPPPSD